MKDEVRIIYYKGHNPALLNRARKRQLDKELKKINRLKQIDLAFQKAKESESEVNYKTLLGIFKGEYEKECIKLSKIEFRFFDINYDFMEQKYGVLKYPYSPNGISIISKIRKFVNRF